MIWIFFYNITGMNKEIINKFIVFEGLDGAGTSTQSKLLSDKIKNSFLTFEPTDSKIGILIRDCLKKNIHFSTLTLAYLFSADREDHLYKKDGIINKCRNNEVVISDRYLFSSLAYQSLDVPFENVLELNKHFPLPEILFFLNTPVDVCMERINFRGNKEELYENDALQEKILNNYLKAFSLYENEGLNIIRLDGNLPKEELLEIELQYLKNFKII